MGDGHDDGCDDEREGGIDPRAIVKFGWSVIPAEYEAEGKSPQNIGDGRADDVANGKRWTSLSERGDDDDKLCER